ncbi:hypothetical protein AGOR_G00195080 [Albula goreensis]|uniref:Uncharacterized protein n=1 Tax=Albula goreensis TaxID=1534307 RepID=A0A8T3CRS9_9TELE|nr:hypothetical protein AGOR_G00195080 [Albula goreensis]
MKTTKSVTIGEVTKGQFKLSNDGERFRGRLTWNSSTGLFSITELKMEDEGEYRVDYDDSGAKRKYFLTVYRTGMPSQPEKRGTGMPSQPEKRGTGMPSQPEKRELKEETRLLIDGNEAESHNL